MVTQEYLTCYFNYDAISGVFSRKIDGYTPRTPDRTNGYFRIRILGKLHYVHRLIWLYQTGSFPKGEIEHKDRNRANNKWDNLLDVPKQINALNKSKLRNNISGVTGVYWDGVNNKWRAEVQHNGKKYKLGRFDNIDDAKTVCLAKRHELGFSTTHGQ